jgi:catechol 2,3-dioxygenase-like lactoylglutathione lyase family enzyme
MNFNSLIPELSVSNLSKSLEFYRDILGFKIEYARPEEKFAFLAYENVQLMIEQANGNWETAELCRPFGRGVNFQMIVGSVQLLINNLQGAGIELFSEPEVIVYRTGSGSVKQRQFLVMDPDGYLLRFCEIISS